MIRAVRMLPFFGALLVGCSDDFSEITDVEGPRTLAVVVSVVGEPERASPALGDTAHVELVVADRGPRLPRDFVMVACRPSPSDRDVGVCDAELPGSPFVGSTTPDPSLAPGFDLVVPVTDLGSVSELLVHGAVCTDGPLRADLPLFDFPESFETDNPCEDPEDEGEFVVFRIPVEGSSPNHRPAFGEVTLDGEPWTADASVTDPEEGCLGGSLPTFPADEVERILGVTIPADARESYLDASGTEKVERPYVAFHSTDGDFEGAYALFGDELSREIVYRTRDDRAPRRVPDDGRLVRFTFVLRDGRNGTSVLTRALCLTP